MSDNVKNLPPRIINNLICLLSKTTDRKNLQGLCITGSKNRDGNTYLPLDPIINLECACDNQHEYSIILSVENTFYAITAKDVVHF